MSPRPSVFAARTGAVIAMSSAALHVNTLFSGLGPVAATLMVAMVAGCLVCAVELWVRGSVRAWLTVALMNLAMIAVHLPMSAAHQHAAALTGSVPGATTASLATLVAAAEVVVAATVLFVHTRHYPDGPAAT